MTAPFINRELSWIEFNARVLSEAENRDVPLLERLKFLAIVSNNFDEFFMVRAASVKRQVLGNQRSSCPTGMSPRSQLREIHRRSAEVTERMYRILEEDVLPGLAAERLLWIGPEEWDEDQRAAARALFLDRVLPVLTPVRMQPGEPLTTVGNLALHAAFLLDQVDPGKVSWPEDASDIEANTPPVAPVALVRIPGSLDRIVYLPHRDGKTVAFTFLEQIIVAEGEQLFPGYTVRESCLFRVTRDADLGVDEERDEDFVEAMEQVLETRQRSGPVRLSINRRSERLREMIVDALGLEKQEVYLCPDPLELDPLMKLAGIDGYEHLRNELWRPQPSAAIDPELPVWESLRRRDVLVHLPYETFDPVVRLIREAAEDEDTLAIKITLYRVSGDSPIARALEAAAQRGKQVTVVVELKARFDEQTNIGLAQRLERAGAIVIHGIARMKVHAKALLVTRRTARGVERYVYLSTGNFNDRTATLYGDTGIFSAREQLASEVGLFFNALTGYSVIPGLRKLVLAPGSLRTRLLELIRREGSRSGGSGGGGGQNKGLIMAKMNSLVDPDLIQALYVASRQGVRILLNVRGICMLVPGVEGVSTGIRVVSVVDRYLEHSRIFYFDNDGAGEMYLASADWMPRNLDKRVELMFPVEDPDIRRRLREALDLYFADTCKAHQLKPDHSWERVTPKRKAPVLRAQEELYRRTLERARGDETESRQMFKVRRISSPGSGS
jgi:polyphosphate kinase